MFHASIIADSVNPAGNRLTTFKLVYPRLMHPELLTHRVFSRNAASSRAIPVKRMVDMIETEPAMPIHWGANQSGMSADAELSIADQTLARAVWLDAAKDAVRHARRMIDLGAHKQIANRLLEPFAHMTTILSATEFDNYFALRSHEKAQPEFQLLATMMLREYLAHAPAKLPWGEFHLPFGDRMPDGADVGTRVKIAVARCARVSYLNFEGTIDVDRDIRLHNDLAKDGHWSPFEHVAIASKVADPSNFRGWHQYRKNFAGENRRNVDLSQVLQRMSPILGRLAA